MLCLIGCLEVKLLYLEVVERGFFTYALSVLVKLNLLYIKTILLRHMYRTLVVASKHYVPQPRRVVLGLVFLGLVPHGRCSGGLSRHLRVLGAKCSDNALLV